MDVQPGRVDRSIRDVLDRLSRSWERGDAEAYGACFTPDASYVTFVGTVYRGREDIVGAHRALFSSLLKGTRLTSEVLDVRRYGEDTAVVTTRGDTYKRKPGTPTKVQTLTLVRDSAGEWSVAAFQNTQRKKLMEAISFRLQPATRPRAGR